MCNIHVFGLLLDEQLDKLPISSKHCLICGGFNLDLRIISCNNKVPKPLCKVMASSCLLTCVLKRSYDSAA